MFIYIVLLCTDQPIFVVVTLAEYIIQNLLIEGFVPRLPIFFEFQFQVVFYLQTKQTL